MYDRPEQRFDALRQQQAENILVLRAAAEIAAQDQEEFIAAQDLPEPPEEVVARLDAGVHRALKGHNRRHKASGVLAGFTRAAAVLLILSGAVLMAGYFTVDAAREAINEFFLENFGTHTIVHTQETDKETGNAFPVDWNGSIRPAWIPSRFNAIKLYTCDRTEFLYYKAENSVDSLSISVWPASVAPAWDAENISDIESLLIQDVPATLCCNNDNNYLLLRFTKADRTVQIVGLLTREEILKIAENISF